MCEVNAVVAICDSRSEAEEAVKELQSAGFDMTSLSIVGDAKTGRVMLVCNNLGSSCFLDFHTHDLVPGVLQCQRPHEACSHGTDFVPWVFAGRRRRPHGMKSIMA